jgi:shikimate kinase
MARSEPTRRIFLIGFMGAGKTSVGRALAARLGWKFIDLDNVIEAREQATVAAIFASRGEAEFRRAESAALKALLKNDAGSGSHNLVIALGGGTFAQPANRAELDRARAVTVLLQAPLEELRRRCQEAGNVRPLAQDADRFTELFATRQSAYALAQYRVDTMGKTVEQVADEIEQITSARPEVKE